MLAELALYELQLNVVYCPYRTDVGDAVIVQVGTEVGCGGIGVEYTPTLAVQVFVAPLALRTVSTKFRVLCKFENVREPLSATVPASVSVADTAFCVFQLSVLEPPCCTDVGDAESVQVGFCC